MQTTSNLPAIFSQWGLQYFSFPDGMQVQMAFAHFFGFAIISLLDSPFELPHIDPSELDALTRQKDSIGTGVYCDVQTGFIVLNRH